MVIFSISQDVESRADPIVVSGLTSDLEVDNLFNHRHVAQGESTTPTR